MTAEDVLQRREKQPHMREIPPAHRKFKGNRLLAVLIREPNETLEALLAMPQAWDVSLPPTNKDRDRRAKFSDASRE